MSLIMRQMQRYDAADEARFLRQQADDATNAIKQTLARMQETAKDAADVRWWTQRYPWYAVGSAGLLGFVTARSLSASARGHERASHQPREEVSSQPSVYARIFSWLVPLVRRVLLNALIEAFQSREDEPAPGPQSPTASVSDQGQ
jgi:ElaB/YqjD/DUF883 family membrane-anchored ribosome-binding protein